MASQVTLGIDLSSQDRHTAACVVAWGQRDAEVIALELGVGDRRLIELAAAADKVGIDVPLGWPVRFAEAVWSYSRGEGWPADYEHHIHRDEMRFRATDRWIAQQHHQIPLSVASDKLAIPAMRAAWLVPHLQDTPVDPSGRGKVLEVYPALALRCWDLTCRNYKSAKGTTTRRALTASLLGRIPWLALQGFRAALDTSDDRLDALVAALVARAHSRHACEAIPGEHVEDARREGWIAIPGPTSLETLVD